MCGEHNHDDANIQEAVAGARFKVAEMSCNHCAGSIRKAFEQLMPGTAIGIDIGAREVTVAGDPESAANAIRAAGYEPELLA
ncbi:heavy-metal-associated domain-containing protein [Natronohydrobacter thiooxidans]|uniref:heavy-metal-associated domain-containing protein n=1 Tax=Natronohydrobacter thiooxidans TaxID=87172 RepID=UPI000A5C09C1|nr:heavy metal-associated domain-containing protein [Natronohydrobacter thiooxidans]